MKHSSKLLLVLLALGVGAALAQEPASQGVGIAQTFKVTVTPEFLATKIKATEAATDLDEAAKSRLVEQYRKAMSFLEAARAQEGKAAAYKQALEKAPGEAEAIRTELAARGAAPPRDPVLPATATVTEVEQQLAKTKADAVAVATKLAEIEKELEASTSRPNQARQAITEAKRALDELEAELALPPPPDEPAALTEARRWTLEAQRQALRTEVLMLDQELLSESARSELLKAKQGLTARNLTEITAAANAVETQLAKLLQEKAQSAALETEEAQRQAADKHALVQRLAERNAELSAELTALTADLDRSTGAQKEIEALTRDIDENFRNARQRLEAAGLTKSLGQVLIDQRKRLPDLRIYRAAAGEREEAIAEVSLRQIRNSEEQRSLQDLDAYVDQMLADKVEDEERAGVAKELRKLAEQRKTLLAQAAETGAAYLRLLGNLDYAAARLTEVAEAYGDFLSERLLWVRSAAPVSRETLEDLPTAMLWAVDPSNWKEVGQVFEHEATRSVLFWAILLTVAALLWKAPAMRRGILATAEPLRRIASDRIRFTLEALVLTLLLAAPLSLLLAGMGWRLVDSAAATDFTKAIGTGAISVSLGLYYLRAFRVLCMPGGVADRHFRWTSEVLKVLRRNFDWLLPLLAPLGFVASAAYAHEDALYGGSLGRSSLIAFTVGLTVFFARVLDPRQGALRNMVGGNPEGWLDRSRRLWYPPLVALPLFLGALTAFGYEYAAGLLLGSLVQTLYLVLAIIVVHQLVIRWLVLTRRRLALQAALERDAARRVPAEQAGQGAESDGAATVDLASLDEQTRKLISTSLFFGSIAMLWLIWSPVLPALGIFDDIALWHYVSAVDGNEQLVPVSLADIGLVFLIALVATVAVKNLPGLLEILLLARMRVSAGSRYAIKTLTGYFIVAVAALTVFGHLGLTWGQVQWLVAALGVGIGFGLQEIVANFISGLIILFERPVRVGDIVTIGDTTGTVSKIRIRATTIRNWDKQELLVPNKEFITGRLLNWTLSDEINRVVIKVGVDYGADVPLALSLLEKAAHEHPEVLADPAPIITFEGFGDSALTLVLRCYLANLNNLLRTVSDLHLGILEKFRAAGITIAFPQRDVHLDTARPLEVRVERARGGAAEPSARDATAVGF